MMLAQRNNQWIVKQLAAVIPYVVPVRAGLEVHRDHQIEIAAVQAGEALRCFDLLDPKTESRTLAPKRQHCGSHEAGNCGGERPDGHPPDQSLLHRCKIRTGSLELCIDQCGVLEQQFGLWGEPHAAATRHQHGDTEIAAQPGDLL